MATSDKDEKNIMSTLSVADKIVGTDIDEATADIVQAEEEYTEEQYAKLLRKIDWTLLPLMWLAYGLQQADKKSTSTQATFGLREATGLVGQQYSWLSTIFYLAYMVAEAPGNYLLQRLNIGRFLGCMMFTWGLVVLCIAFAKNFTHLMILRTIQGIAECTISPTFLILTGTWYRTSEHPHRALIWGTANAGFGTINDLICYGIGHAAERAGNFGNAWKDISYWLGGCTMAVAIPVFFVLGTPREVRWLSSEQKRMAMARVVQNQTGSDRHHRTTLQWNQVKECFIDPQTWFLSACVVVGSLPNGGVTTFINIVYTSFGFTPLDALLKGALPRDMFSIVWFLLVGWINLRHKSLRCEQHPFSATVAR
jgi:ACS family allantoate permease-like MFS transporter